MTLSYLFKHLKLYWIEINIKKKFHQIKLEILQSITNNKKTPWWSQMEHMMINKRMQTCPHKIPNLEKEMYIFENTTYDI
jgi:hypothetical protein